MSGSKSIVTCSALTSFESRTSSKGYRLEMQLEVPACANRPQLETGHSRHKAQSGIEQIFSLRCAGV